MNVPIENYVSNFIFLNDDEQQEDNDMSQLDPITIQELAAVKEEIFCGETKIKKSKRLFVEAFFFFLLIIHFDFIGKLESVHHQDHEEDEQNPQPPPLTHHNPHLHSHHHDEHQEQQQQQHQQLHESISVEQKPSENVLHEVEDEETEIIIHRQRQESPPRMTSLTTVQHVTSPTTVWVEAPTAGPSTAAAVEHKEQKQNGEFVIFGSYVAEVMKNMEKTKARMLQMKVLQLITEYDAAN